MGTSGNPAKKAAQKSVSSVADFKKRREGQLLTLPSGNTVRAVHADVRAFIVDKGEIPNPLMPIVTEALNKGQANLDPKLLLGDDGNLDMNIMEGMIEVIDRVMVECVIEPRCFAAPTQKDLEVWNRENPKNLKSHPDDLRDEDKLYPDDLDIEDRMFIFGWSSGGTDDVATFRAESDANLASLGQVEGVREAAE